MSLNFEAQTITFKLSIQLGWQRMKGLVGYRWVMLALAFLITFTEHVLLFSYSPLIPQIMLDMGLSNFQAFSLFSACFLTLMILRIPWGLFSDRVGVRRAVGLAVALMGVAGVLRGFAADYWMLLASQLLLGVGFAAAIPGLPKLAGDWFLPREMGFATGVYVAGFSVGSMIGLGLTPYLLALTGSWRNAFFVYGSWGLILATLWWIAAREPRVSRKMVRTDDAKSSIPLKKSFGLVIGMKEVWILTGLFLCTAGIYDATATLLPYSLELRGISPIMAGSIASMLPAGFFVSTLVVGKLSDWVGLRRPFILMLGAACIPAIFVVGTASGAGLWIATFIAGFCVMGIFSLLLAIPPELPKATSYVGSVVGVMSSFGNISSLILPVATGYLMDITGSFIPALIMLAVVGGLTVPLGLALKETGRRRQNG